MTAAHRPPSSRPLDVSGTALNLLTILLWGGNAVATSFSTDVLPPIAVSGLRFLMATAVMALWCWAERASLRIHRNQWQPILISGLLLYLQIWTFTLGVAWSSSSHASLFVNTYPFWVVLIQHFGTHDDRLTRQKVAGLGAALLGIAGLMVATALRTGHSLARDVPTLAGDGIMLLSALLYAIKFVYTKRVLRVIGPSQLMFWQDLVAVVLFAASSWMWEQADLSAVSLTAWLALAYQGVLVGGVAFGLQTWLLKHYAASEIAVYAFLVPLVGIVLGSWLRGDELSVWLVVGGLCIAGGIALVTRRPRVSIELETRGSAAGGDERAT